MFVNSVVLPCFCVRVFVFYLGFSACVVWLCGSACRGLNWFGFVALGSGLLVWVSGLAWLLMLCFVCLFGWICYCCLWLLLVGVLLCGLFAGDVAL